MSNIKQKRIVNAPDEFISEVISYLATEGKVKVNGLGIFELKTIPSRLGRNPRTGGEMMIPSYVKAKFRPTASLRASVQKYAGN